MVYRQALQRLGLALAATTLLGLADAHAAGLPGVRTGADNVVPGCATPGRLMAFARSRNNAIDRRFDTIAAEYKAHGEDLGMRWDIAFFHMLTETGDLSFTKGGRQSVKAEQNNFAGLGAASSTEPGESFADVGKGVRAHLEHLLVYAGQRVERPVAERTRKVQEWGVLKSWQQKIKGPMTYSDLFFHWANRSKAFGEGIEQTATSFMADHCRKPDPVDQVAARPAPKAAEPAEPKVSGVDLAKKAIDDARAEGNKTRFGLGAGGTLAKQPPTVTVINEPPAADATPAKSPPAQVASAPASAASAAKAATLPKSAEAQKPVPAGQKCRVWTASYGGEKALIIRSTADSVVNLTILVVNAGQETREAEAYIAAYAKGGAVAFEFANQNEAIDKAFELCPEG